MARPPPEGRAIVVRGRIGSGLPEGSFGCDRRSRRSRADTLGTIVFGLDDNGNPETVTEGSAVLTRTFDDLDRVESYTDSRTNEVGYEWYDNGLLKSITYPDKFYPVTRTVTYTYYPNNLLKTVTDWANRTTTYHWSPAGELIGIDRPNGVDRINQFDGAGQLERIYERDGEGNLLAYFRFGFDSDGRIDSRFRLPFNGLYPGKFIVDYWHDAIVNPTSGTVGGSIIAGIGGAGQGAWAAADGIIPFINPFQSTGYYDPTDPIMQLSHEYGMYVGVAGSVALGGAAMNQLFRLAPAGQPAPTMVEQIIIATAGPSAVAKEFGRSAYYLINVWQFAAVLNPIYEIGSRATKRSDGGIANTMGLAVEFDVSLGH